MFNGSLKIISSELIILHSISTRSEVNLDVKSPFLFSVKKGRGSEIIFLCKSVLKSCTIPLRIGVRKYKEEYLKRFLKKNVIRTKIQIKRSASNFPFSSITELIIA